MASTYPLKQAWQRKQAKNQHYSLRALARDLSCSPGFLSRVLSGTKQAPLPLLIKLLQKLEVPAEDWAQLVFKNRYEQDQFLKEYLQQFKQFKELLNDSEDMLQFDSSGDFEILEQWYYVAIMEAFNNQAQQRSVECLAQELDLNCNQVTEALKFLVSQGYLEQSSQGLQKTKRILKVPSLRTDEKLRNFHSQFIEKAIEHMHAKTENEDYERRLISGATLSINPEMVPKAKAHLQRALIEVLNILSQGEATEVYQVNLQLFPLISSAGGDALEDVKNKLESSKK